jgi:hypothetical protein
MGNPTEQSIDPYRWGYIFGQLSLDMVHPFVSDMGLQLPEGNEFMIGLRGPIEAVHTVQDPALAPAVFGWLTLEYGVVFVDHLLRWGVSVFQYDVDQDEGAYWWDQTVACGTRLSDIEVPEFISRVSSSLTKYPPREISEAVPTTAWDKYLYSREEYDEVHIETIQATIYHYSFVNAWREAMYTFSNDVDWDEIHRWGIRVKERLPGQIFGRLEPPKAWELPLPWR